MDIWVFIQNKLRLSIDVMLLVVVENIGSSPGRAGFMMAVAADGELYGTIGGGIMEHKLVELARSLLPQQTLEVRLIQQFHNKEQSANQSGMICSGQQSIAFVPLAAADISLVEAIVQAFENKLPQALQLNPEGVQLVQESVTSGFVYHNEKNWCYNAPLTAQPVVHIIGAGHCGLALSEQMHFLGFLVHIYDDRPALNTLLANRFAKHHITNYETIGESMPLAATDFVVIMTIGYRYDKIVLKQLLDLPCRYLGMLGSAAKVQTLFQELQQEGIRPEKLQKVFAPIGVAIHSQSSQEIAVSIAAEIIREKNTRKS